jgi:hypothetical protein
VLNLIIAYDKIEISNLEKKYTDLTDELHKPKEAPRCNAALDQGINIIEGKNMVYKRIREVCCQAQQELLIMCNDLVVPDADVVGNLCVLLDLAQKRKVKVKLLTTSAPENIKAACLLLKKTNITPAFLEVRYVSCLSGLPNLIIGDETELVIWS